MNIRQLETLVWVAALKSFQAAALRLNVTQPAVSARIATLESEVGAPLFDRSQSQPTLTARGEQVARYAQEVLKLTRALKDEDPNAAPAGQSIVRMGAIPTLAHAWLPELVELLGRRFPSVEAEIVVETSDHLRRRLSQRELDVAFLFGPSFDNDVRSVWLGNARIVWAAGRSLGLAGKRLKAEDLRSHVIISYETGSHVNFEIRRLLRERGIAPKGFISTNSTATLLDLMKRGVGIAAVSGVAIEADRQAGLVDVLNLEFVLPEFEVFASYLGSAPNPIGSILTNMAAEVSGPYHRKPVAVEEPPPPSQRKASPGTGHAVPRKRSKTLNSKGR